MDNHTSDFVIDSHGSLDSEQIEILLNKVDMQNSLLKLGSNDQKVIEDMKDTIQYQQSVILKREKLVQAINHNVKHL